LNLAIFKKIIYYYYFFMLKEFKNGYELPFRSSIQILQVNSVAIHLDTESILSSTSVPYLEKTRQPFYKFSGTLISSTWSHIERTTCSWQRNKENFYKNPRQFCIELTVETNKVIYLYGHLPPQNLSFTSSLLPLKMRLTIEFSVQSTTGGMFLQVITSLYIIQKKA